MHKTLNLLPATINLKQSNWQEINNFALNFYRDEMESNFGALNIHSVNDAQWPDGKLGMI